MRTDHDDDTVPDEKADQVTNEELREYPQGPVGDPDRAAGPLGNRGGNRGDPMEGESPNPPVAGEIELRSAAFADHDLIPDRYSYDGGNVSPPLQWWGLPDGTAELALLCEDPDAPVGTFVHWVVTGISADLTGLDEDSLPDGAVGGRNGFGKLGWAGPRPPIGDEPHRYFFRLHAVDRPLGIDAGASADDVRARLAEHALARATLVGLFGR